MNIELNLRVMDRARLTTDGIHFDSIEGQALMNRVFQERLACLSTGPDEIGFSDGKVCSRCHKDAEWSEAIRQRTVLNCRCGLVNSSWH